MSEEVENETPKERGVRKALTGETSEFGEGVIIPLVYFTKHLENDQARRIQLISYWFKMGKPPVNTLAGKYDRELVDAVQYFNTIRRKQTDAEELSHMIETFLNGASDHLYGLQIPQSFPADLKARMETLRDRALKMGHGFTGTIWTIDDFDNLWELTKDVAHDIDKLVLGIEDADKGQYD